MPGNHVFRLAIAFHVSFEHLFFLDKDDLASVDLVAFLCLFPCFIVGAEIVCFRQNDNTRKPRKKNSNHARTS